MVRQSLVRAARLTHLDARSRPTMVDVGDKPVTHRIAQAEARVHRPALVARELERSGHRTKKGPVFDTAILAGVMAAKRTSELIPFCHPLAIEQCQLDIELEPARGGAAVVIVRCLVGVHHKTGVEMEALVAVSISALTLYDMLKAADKGIEIREIVLERKSGGKSGEYRRRK